MTQSANARLDRCRLRVKKNGMLVPVLKSPKMILFDWKGILELFSRHTPAANGPI